MEKRTDNYNWSYLVGGARFFLFLAGFLDTTAYKRPLPCCLGCHLLQLLLLFSLLGLECLHKSSVKSPNVCLPSPCHHHQGHHLASSGPSVVFSCLLRVQTWWAGWPIFVCNFEKYLNLSETKTLDTIKRHDCKRRLFRLMYGAVVWSLVTRPV